jgi:hypothetical protein
VHSRGVWTIVGLLALVMGSPAWASPVRSSSTALPVWLVAPDLIQPTETATATSTQLIPPVLLPSAETPAPEPELVPTSTTPRTGFREGNIIPVDMLVVTLQLAAGSVSFVPARDAQASSYTSTVRVVTGRDLAESLRLGLEMAWSKEWSSASLPGPTSALSASLVFDELTLSLTHAHLVEVASVVVSGRVLASAPTSRAAIDSYHVLGVGGELEASRTLGPVTAQLTAGAHTFLTLAGEDTQRDEWRSALAGRCVDVRDTSCLFLAGFVPAWRLTAEARVAVAFTTELGLVVRAGLAESGPHGSSPTDVARTTSSGSVELGYRLPQGFMITAGIASAQLAKDQDGDVRFIFFDVATPESNASALFMAVSWSL